MNWNQDDTSSYVNYQALKFNIPLEEKKEITHLIETYKH